jgi:hypothetical protein
LYNLLPKYARAVLVTKDSYVYEVAGYTESANTESLLRRGMLDELPVNV